MLEIYRVSRHGHSQHPPIPDKRLRDRAKPVPAVTPEIVALIEDMKETMYAAPGCGLAAPQIGVIAAPLHRRYRERRRAERSRVFINPEIIAREGKNLGKRGASLSRGVHEEIERAAKVTVRASNERGRGRRAHGRRACSAVAVQHENDHLDGMLMIDHMGVLKRRLALRKLQRQRAGGAELEGRQQGPGPKPISPSVAPSRSSI